MRNALIVGGIIILIISFFIGLDQNHFLLFILCLAGGATLSIIWFALAYIINNQTRIIYYLENQEEYINTLRKEELPYQKTYK